MEPHKIQITCLTELTEEELWRNVRFYWNALINTKFDDADFDDEKWLNEQIKLLPIEYATSSGEDLTLFFETIMDRLEKTTSHSSNVLSIEY